MVGGSRLYGRGRSGRDIDGRVHPRTLGPFGWVRWGGYGKAWAEEARALRRAVKRPAGHRKEQTNYR